MRNIFEKYISNFGTDWTVKDDVLIKVSENGLNLKFADYGLRDDKDIVIRAVENNPRSLQYASRLLREDQDVIYAAIPGGEQFIANDFLVSRSLALDVATYKSHIMDQFNNDKEIVLAALRSDSRFRTFKPASEELKNDKSFMLKVVKISGLCIQYASKNIQDDEKIAEAAINSWHSSLNFTSHRIKNSKKFQKIYMKSAKKILRSKSLAEKGLIEILEDNYLQR